MKLKTLPQDLRDVVEQIENEMEVANKAKKVATADYEKQISQTHEKSQAEISSADDTYEWQINDARKKFELCQSYFAQLEAVIDEARAGSRAFDKIYLSYMTTRQVPNGIMKQQELTTLPQCETLLLNSIEKAKQIKSQIAGNSMLGSISGSNKAGASDLLALFVSAQETVSTASNILSDEKNKAFLQRSSKNDKTRAQENSTKLELEQVKIQSINQAEQDAMAGIREATNAVLGTSLRSCIESALTMMPGNGTNPYIHVGEYITKNILLDSTSYFTVIDEASKDYWDGAAFHVPIVLDRRESGSAMFCFEPGASPELPLHAMWEMMKEQLTSNEAPSQLFHLMNPGGERITFEPFLPLARDFPEIFGDSVINERATIEAKLSELSQMINIRSQKTLIGYEDVYAFNAAPSTADLPLVTACLRCKASYMTPSMKENIHQIVVNGGECGVGIILVLELDQEPNESDPDTMFPYGEHLVDDTMMVYRDVSTKHCHVTANDLFSLQASILSGIEKNKVKSVDMNTVMSSDSIGQGDTSNGLSIPFGRSETGAPVNLEFGDSVAGGSSHYALMAGSTGSGKSSLLHSIVVGALRKYSPDELEIYIMDFKSGVEFEGYTHYRIPQLRLLALDAMQAFGYSILAMLQYEMKKRSALFKEANVSSLAEYRHITHKKMPRILVIMDEFQVLFNEEHDKLVARQCATMMADLVSLGRVYGFHFLLATQTMSRIRYGTFSINSSTLAEMHVRIGLQCSPEESQLLFGEIHGKEAALKMAPVKGSGVYSQHDVHAQPEAFNAVHIPKPEREKLLSEVAERYQHYEQAPTRVFRADSIPSLGKCKELKQFPPDAAVSGFPALLGEPIRIDEPVRVKVSRIRRSSLLVVGQNRPMLDAIISAYTFSTLKSMMSDSPSVKKAVKESLPIVYLCDGLSLIGEGGAENSIVGAFSVKYPAYIKTAGSQADVLKMVDYLYDLLCERRMKSLSNKEMFATLHLIINEMQWVDAFSAILDGRDSIYEAAPIPQEISTFMLDDILGGTASTHISRRQKLDEILESGYAQGINVVVSCSDTIAMKTRIYDLVPKFQNKVVFAMNGAEADRIIPDSEHLVDTAKDNMAVFADGIQPPFMFKPYSVPKPSKSK